MAIFGTVPTLRAQLARPDHFAAAFHYLAQAMDPTSAVAARIRAVPEGETRRVELAGGAFALEQAYRTKPAAEGRFEAHRAHVDLQAILEGNEVMDVTRADLLTVSEDFKEGGDVCFFDNPAEASRWIVRPGEVAVFFPIDAHKPSLQLTESELVYKTVVKVPVPA